MNPRPKITVGLLLVAIHPLTSVATEPEKLPKNLEVTLDLYLSSNAAYQADDLIPRSNFEEFQGYLKRTQGPSLATHPRWSKMMLADHDSLVRAFHTGGAPILRAAAEATGGYDKLHKLSVTSAGRSLIAEAIRRKSPAKILDAISADAKKQVTGEPKTEKPKQPVVRKHIYTATEFMAVVRAAQEATEQRHAAKISPMPAEK